MTLFFLWCYNEPVREHPFSKPACLMSHNINRIQLLRGDLTGTRLPLRPPWALPETDFIDYCDRCGDCIPACEAGVIKVGQGGYPQIDFSTAGCSFCRECLRVCKQGALHYGEASDPTPWNLKATILDGCLSLNAVICRSCGEACDEHAIRFQLETGGVARLRLDWERCSGCGACLAVCPAKEIKMTSIETSNEAA